MKIRIKENSLRLRLTKSEVENFCNSGSHSQTINFGGSQLQYSLIVSDDTDKLTSSFESNHVKVFMPTDQKIKWADENQVGFSNVVTLDDDTNLLLKVEKDFVCLDDTEEDQSDNYPNPNL